MCWTPCVPKQFHLLFGINSLKKGFSNTVEKRLFVHTSKKKFFKELSHFLKGRVKAILKESINIILITLLLRTVGQIDLKKKPLLQAQWSKNTLSANGNLVLKMTCVQSYNWFELGKTATRSLNNEAECVI